MRKKGYFYLLKPEDGTQNKKKVLVGTARERDTENR